MRKITTILLLLCLSATLMQAQITIGGNIYGGGNAGDTKGNTNVTVYAGDLNRVFGGAQSTRLTTCLSTTYMAATTFLESSGTTADWKSLFQKKSKKPQKIWWMRVGMLLCASRPR